MLCWWRLQDYFGASCCTCYAATREPSPTRLLHQQLCVKHALNRAAQLAYYSRSMSMQSYYFMWITRFVSIMLWGRTATVPAHSDAQYMLAALAGCMSESLGMRMASTVKHIAETDCCAQTMSMLEAGW
jgi:hypothetical protein